LKILVVHVYGFIDSKNLGVQSETVCRGVLEIHHHYDRIYLVGGWHSEDLPNYLVSSDLMIKFLEKNGVSKSKMHSLALVNYLNPPRDTMEEVDILPKLFQASGLPLNQKFDAIGLWFHITRIRMLYRLRKLNCRKVIPTFSWSTLKRNQWTRVLQELPGLLLTWLDPDGKGRFIQNLRKGRTHNALLSPFHSLMTWSKDVPQYWRYIYTPGPMTIVSARWSDGRVSEYAKKFGYTSFDPGWIFYVEYDADSNKYYDPSLNLIFRKKRLRLEIHEKWLEFI